MSASDAPETLRFGDFELDVAAYQLRRRGQAVRLERQPMDLLLLLLQRRGQLVSRADIVDRLWGKDVFVDADTGVHKAIRKIRLALGDSTESPAWVETVPGKGYRFTAPVDVSTPEAVVPPPDTAPVTPPAPAAEPGPRWRIPLALAVLSAVLLLGLIAWARLRTGPSRVTIAVLPFENLSGDAERQYLADGLTEETIASFGHIDPKHLSVIGRTSAMAYRGTHKTLAEIGRELGADFLVESSIRAEGPSLRVTARLVRVRDQTEVWSDSFDREPTSLMGLQRELSASIAEPIRLRLAPEDLQAIDRRQTRNAEAYDLYLRGLYYWNQLTPATNQRAIGYFEQAIALDPEYALAWSGIAVVTTGSTINGDAPPREVGPRARAAASRALAAAPGLSEAQSSAGAVAFYLDWDWPAAEAALRRAIALDPSNVYSYRLLGHVLSQCGRDREAASFLRRARELDPLYAMNHALSAQAAFQARDYQAALAHARKAVAIAPGFWIGHAELALAYERLGETDRALEEADLVARLSQDNSKAQAMRGYLLARAGRLDEARALVASLQDLSRQRYLPPYTIAMVQAGLGDRDGLFASLDRAYEARDVHLIFLPVDPKWDPYRADPRFAALIARCGFPSRPVP